VITPAGTECPFYFEDFHRGRSIQECRLIDNTPGGGTWTPPLCEGCRVPAIKRANACEHLVMEARVRSSFLGLRKEVEITATCTKSLEDVAEPEVGCGQCHFDFPKFATAPENL
jgi:hypothetical protein